MAIASFQDANPEVSDVEADCLVGRLIDRYGLDGLETRLAEDPPDPRFEEAQFRDMFGCGVEGDVRDQIAEQLAANGVEATDAPCVADELVAGLTDDDIDVLLSGDITDEFFAKFFAAMEACGAVNS
ncbi:MAG: hypothetical protein AAF547_05360 [Actinomycetota bacterium]